MTSFCSQRGGGGQKRPKIAVILNVWPLIKTVWTKFWLLNGLSHDVIDWGGSEKFHNVVNVIHTGRGWESEWSKMEMFPARKFWGNSWLAGKECLHACNIISFFLSPFFCRMWFWWHTFALKSLFPFPDSKMPKSRIFWGTIFFSLNFSSSKKISPQQ